MEKIVKIFIEQDFISLSDSKKMAPPGQADPEIILTNSLGQQHLKYCNHSFKKGEKG